MEILLDNWIFLACLPIVAFLYASVGHGGASGYLALLALFSFPHEIMRSSALLLNIFVAGIAFYFYWKEGHFKSKLFYPFAIASIPASFWGGYINVDPTLYKQILGVLLLFAILRIMGAFGKNKTATTELKLVPALIIGVIIGFFSGLIGIGGGIILSPVILLFAWGGMKETAAVSALFIWVNSMSGMMGYLSSGEGLHAVSFYMILFALIGGAVGAYFGSKRSTSNNTVAYLLAVVLLIASIKLIFLS